MGSLFVKQRALLQSGGLIASATSEESVYIGEKLDTGEASTSNSSSTTTGFPAITEAVKPIFKRRREQRVKLLALDMDGTLLDSRSKVLPSSVEALHAALSTGVKVCLATGKARPAALTAMERVGLAGTKAPIRVPIGKAPTLPL